MVWGSACAEGGNKSGRKVKIRADREEEKGRREGCKREESRGDRNKAESEGR